MRATQRRASDRHVLAGGEVSGSRTQTNMISLTLRTHRWHGLKLKVIGATLPATMAAQRSTADVRPVIQYLTGETKVVGVLSTT